MSVPRYNKAKKFDLDSFLAYFASKKPALKPVYTSSKHKPKEIEKHTKRITYEAKT